MTRTRRLHEDVILDRIFCQLVPLSGSWAQDEAAEKAWNILVAALRERGWLVIPDDAL